MTYHHPTFAYLIESEWEYIPGYSNHGAGDLVFSSSLSLETQSPSWNNLALTSSNLKPQILIVEAKYLQCDSGSTARTKRTKHRGKVKEQLLNSMSAWQRRYPSHDIFGAILSNDRDCCLGSKHVCTSSENDDIYLSPIVSFPDAMSLHTFDDCQVPYDGTPPKMGFGDPLPRAMWGNSSRAHIDMNLWLEIKEYEFNRVNYHCEKCLVGGFDDSSLVLHQRWEYKIDGLTPEQLVEKKMAG
jgi:hypothetical protein